MAPIPDVETEPESLRDRQKRVAREAILQAAADEIAERGLGEFSLQDVAARAGVSARTLYNYFDSRDALFLALGHWSNELAVDQGGANDIPQLDELPETVSRMWRIWEGQGSLYSATSQIAATSSSATEALHDERRRRTDQVRDRVAERWPDLDDAVAEDLAVWLHAALGPVLWERMNRLAGFTAERSGRVNAWVMLQLIDALDRGERPPW